MLNDDVVRKCIQTELESRIKANKFSLYLPPFFRKVMENNQNRYDHLPTYDFGQHFRTESHTFCGHELCEMMLRFRMLKENRRDAQHA